MSVQKYPVVDPDFYIKMRGAAWNEEVRGLCVVLELTGMHIWSVTKLKAGNLKRQGKHRVLEWVRPKTMKTLNRIIPKDDVDIVEAFITKYRRKSRQHYHNVIKEVGQRAGYDDVISPMTYRHQRCISLLKSGKEVWEVPHIMGCTLDTVMKNYTKMREFEEALAY